MGKAAKKQKRSYQERTREVQFRRGDWVWWSYPQLKPGKLQKKNVGPWLVLKKITDLNYRIQRKPGDVPQVVHVDKLTKYQPDFGVTLTSWIEDNNGPRHRATQTDKTTERTFGTNVLKKEGKGHGDGATKRSTADEEKITADQDKLTAELDEPTADPQKPTAIPQKPTADPQKPTVIPQKPTADPQKSTTLVQNQSWIQQNQLQI